MRNLNNSEVQNISGAAWWKVEYDFGKGLAVTDNSVFYDKAGYTYYAFHVVDPYGNTVFKGNNGSFRTIYGVDVLVQPMFINGAGSSYIIVY